MLGTGTSCLQALVHCGDGNIELGDDVSGNAAVVRLADDTGDPDVGPRAGNVAVVTDRRRNVRHDDALNPWHGSPGVNLVKRAKLKDCCL